MAGRFLSDGLQTTPEKYAAQKAYRERNRALLAQKALEKTRKLKTLVYGHYGSLCNCCGERRTTMLSVDHVNNDGYKDRHSASRGSSTTRIYAKIIRLGFPPDFQILCMNCNFSKKRTGGRCEHQLEGECKL